MKRLSPLNWMSVSRLGSVLQLSLVGLLLGVIVCGHFTNGFPAVERFLSKQRFALLERPASGNIVVVDIDARSLAEVGVWPWPRRIHGHLIEKLLEADAAEIGFDIDFSSASNAVDDSYFEAMLKRAEGRVDLAVFRQVADQQSSGSEPNLISRPLPRFEDHAWPATVTVPIEKDSAVWRAEWGEMIDGEVVPSLAALIGGRTGEAGQTFWIDYSIDLSGIEVFSLTDVVNDRIDPERFAGKKVIVAASAQELRDLFPVPVHDILPGGMIQALAAETIAQGRALEPAGGALILLVTLVLGLTIFVQRKVDWRIRLALLLGLAPVLEALALVVQAQIPILPQTACAQLALLVLALGLAGRQVGLHQLLLRVTEIHNQNNRRLLSRVLEDSFDGIILVEQCGAVRAASRSARAIWGEALQPGSRLQAIVPGQIWQDLERVFSSEAERDWQPVRQDVEAGDETSVRKVIEYVVTPMSQVDVLGGRLGSQVQEVRLAILTCRDVTMQRKAMDRLGYLASHDPVTSLRNRLGLEEHLQDICGCQNAAFDVYCLVLISLDDLDQAVASLGFAFGDLLREAAASRLIFNAGEDAFLATLGDNCFACILKEPDEAAIVSRIAKLVEELSAEYELEGSRIHTSVTLGYCLIDTDELDVAVPLRDAGAALSSARKLGGNAQVRYEPAMHVMFERRRRLEMDLAQALEQGRIRAVYQPLVDLATGQITGAEALMRWDHPEFGFISPGEFIPIAEESGQIRQLGAWMLRQATRDAASWPAQLRLAVNVSAVQFSDLELVNVVREALDDSGFEPRRLDLELTESLFIEGGDSVSDQIMALSHLGCGLALDDFGTGYSSLGYIPRFPFTKIKIDKSFVDRVCEDPAHAAIISTVVDLAASFGMNVVAEGIEQASQQQRLIELGCDIGQGFLFGRPMSSEHLAQRLRKAA
ncbi:EAL domain-containing protein [Roseibium suaedae]|uniref:Diguanylate cyclase (GGDEF) domain-containing protein n=1 Tax=Roseibium suaedae TaxID=735517 RepID=A0A1M7D2W8_9HYPH|nr:EAL domain-containing protein [Roseibium suaedae]SHL73810.1 diguanylate cyclase (GGDEF) domain-containing protein [Roseibium suaedae]